jgi:hypothetical protein
MGRAQTGPSDSVGVVGLFQGVAREVTKVGDSRRPLERATRAGDSPLGEILNSSWKQFPSTAGHVQSRGKPGGPSPKAKYSLATDSVPVPRGKGEKNPGEGSEIEPETVCLQAVGAR